MHKHYSMEPSPEVTQRAAVLRQPHLTRRDYIERRQAAIAQKNALDYLAYTFIITEDFHGELR